MLHGFHEPLETDSTPERPERVHRFQDRVARTMDLQGEL